MSVCPICGGSGVTPDLKICSCRINNIIEEEVTQDTMYIPDVYKEVRFDGLLMREPANTKCGEDMNLVYKEWLHKPKYNYFVHAAPNSGKSVFMYSVLNYADENLTRTEPKSIKDLNTILQDGRNTEDVIDIDILIIYLEDVFPIYTQQVISTIMNERARRNKKVIILSNTSWDILIKRFPSMTSYKGDGSFKTFKILEGC